MVAGARTSHRNQEDGWGQSWQVGGRPALAWPPVASFMEGGCICFLSP